jgi:DNA-binding MarR family transcriptional regulator
MSKFTHQLNKVLVMLQSIEDEINLAGYTLTEKKVFFTISQMSENKESCNITDVIKESELSRSTVYKAIKKLEYDKMLNVQQSSFDKREFFLSLSI